MNIKNALAAVTAILMVSIAANVYFYADTRLQNQVIDLAKSTCIAACNLTGTNRQSSEGKL